MVEPVTTAPCGAPSLPGHGSSDKPDRPGRGVERIAAERAAHRHPALERTGHFAAFEQPGLFAEEPRTFSRMAR
ncbi:hypothetical protein FXF51_17235 [Nonomuraea sp. PA05]|uniref:hypothetical protein n=1 Tax=Nonomuraea sp. PA05 TaxID=2604466 RepID=UPI0011D79615|nr:hypothetical protein [Nonomuraea sp. PA05]TYB66829.1 hypothetical protein FXF51_17235 [Nonomuraea sp. PA05]